MNSFVLSSIAYCLLDERGYWLQCGCMLFEDLIKIGCSRLVDQMGKDCHFVAWGCVIYSMTQYDVLLLSTSALKIGRTMCWYL